MYKPQVVPTDYLLLFQEIIYFSKPISGYVNRTEVYFFRKFTYKFDPKPFIDNPDDYSTIEKELDDLESEMWPIYNNLPRTFGDAVKYLMKWRQMTEEDLADFVGVDAREIRYIISGKRGNKRNLTLMCIGMRLPGLIAFELCKMCPKAKIDPQVPEDSRYVHLIAYGQNLSARMAQKLITSTNNGARA